MRWSFGDCELDEGLYQLRREDRVVKLEPRVYDVLLYLLRHRERVVTKAELLDALWPGESVSDSVLPRCVAAARRALGDSRARQDVIQTVHGRGYRFVAELRGVDDLDPLREGLPRAKAAEAGVAEPPGAFVGRGEALARLAAAASALGSGGGGLALLVGEPGIGKTSTAGEFERVLRGRGLRWLTGRCFEGEGAPAYWPWVQALRTLAGELPEGLLSSSLGAGAGDLAELLPELAQPAEHVPSEGLAGEQVRFRLFDSVAAWLQRVARDAPLVVFLDDLHWADADSLLLLQFVASVLRDEPVLLLGTYRDVEVRRGHPLAATLGALAREPHCVRIPLRGLDAAEIGELASSVAGAPVPTELVRALDQMTEGNPFFVRELVRLLAEEGRLTSPLRDSEVLTLPQSVRDVVGRRLCTLSEECNELLRAASVLGRDFDTAVLASLVELPAEELLESLGEGLAARVLEESGGVGRFTFHHALVRQTLYEEISVPRRVQLHRRAGELLLERHGTGREAPLAQLAHHFFQAIPSGTVARAVELAELAAERAHGQRAYDEAARHRGRALEAYGFDPAPDPVRCCELLLALGDELATAGDREPSRARFAEAAERARQLERADLLARAAVGHRGLGVMGMPSEDGALELLEEALSALGQAQPALRARVLSHLTGIPPHSSSMETRQRLSCEAWALAEVTEDPAALSDAAAARYWATLGPDRVLERLSVADDIEALAGRLADPRLAIMGFEVRFGAHLMLGDSAAMDASLDAHERLASELRIPLFLFMQAMIRAAHAMNRGEFGVAEELADRALERGRRCVPYSELLREGQGFWLRRVRGDEARAPGAAARAFFAGRFTGLDDLMRAVVALDVVAADPEAARTELEPLARSGFSGLERDESWLLTVGVCANVSAALGDRAWGADLYELLVPYAGLMLSHDLLRAVAGSVQSVLGELALLIGRADEAAHRYEAGLAREVEAGMRPAAVSSRLGLADALEVRSAPGDPAAARTLRRAAAAEAAVLGMILKKSSSPHRD